MGKTFQRSTGFTLIEVLVSIGIIAGIAAVVSQVFFATTRSNTKTEILKETKQQGEFAMEVMGRMIRSSRTITNTCSSGGTTMQSITVVAVDGGTTTFGCVEGGGVTRIASTSAQRTEYLTSTNVTLGGTDCTGDSLAFTCWSASGVPSEVQIGFRLAQKGTPVDQFETAATPFQTTVIARNVPID